MDTLAPEKRSERMARVKGRDTGPEMRVRRAIFQRGYRYRLQARNLPGRPDLVFRKRKIAIFVHGCFWHRHPDPACKLARWPKSRLEFWRPKLEGNRARDIENQRRLEAAGWKVSVIWECQTDKKDALESMIDAILGTP